jgi:hypothetical protein
MQNELMFIHTRDLNVVLQLACAVIEADILCI